MQNTKRLLSTLTLTSFLALAGCSFPGVYKVDVQQGNVITQDMIDQLRPGMSTNQVRYIMGTPLILDTFNPQRWDYVYSIKPGGHIRQQERISLLFNQEGQLIALAGDFKPGVSRDEVILHGEPQIEDEASLPIIPREDIPELDESIEQEEAPKPTRPELEAEPGSLLDELQKEIDSIKFEPAPNPGKIGH